MYKVLFIKYVMHLGRCLASVRTHSNFKLNEWELCDIGGGFESPKLVLRN